MAQETLADYRGFLDRAFQGRVRRNPDYSLRAFARDLGFPASKLSEIMRGRCGLSRKSGLRIAEKIRLSPEETEYFLTLIESEHARSPSRKKRAQELLERQKALRSFAEMDLDRFRIISDWHHFAILELTETQGFRSNAKWVADRLGITEEQARAAIDRLLENGLLKENSADEWVQTHANLATPSGIPSREIREHHRQIIELAQGSLDATPIQERDFSTMTFAFDPSQMEKARQLIKEFRRRFAEEIQNVGDRQRVYAFSLQFFPLDVK